VLRLLQLLDVRRRGFWDRIMHPRGLSQGLLQREIWTRPRAANGMIRRAPALPVTTGIAIYRVVADAPFGAVLDHR